MGMVFLAAPVGGSGSHIFWRSSLRLLLRLQSAGWPTHAAFASVGRDVTLSKVSLGHIAGTHKVHL